MIGNGTRATTRRSRWTPALWFAVTAVPLLTVAGFGLPVSAAQASVAPGDQVYVALGDSYASGEGLAPFQAGTDMKTGHRNLCHRSSSYAYSDLSPAVVLPGVTSRGFYACSGATTSEMESARTGQYGQPQQTAMVGPLTKWITVQVGGDNLMFSAIGQACGGAEVSHLYFLRIPGKPTCTSELKLETKGLAKLQVDLRTLYGDLLHNAPSARLVVVGYPRVFGSSYRGLPVYQKKQFCIIDHYPIPILTLDLGLPLGVPLLVATLDVGMPLSDAQAIDRFEVKLNDTIKNAIADVAANPADASRIRYADTYSPAVPRNCKGTTPNASVQGLQLSLTRHASGAWYTHFIGSGTFHPTIAGQKMMARAVQAAFRAFATGGGASVTVTNPGDQTTLVGSAAHLTIEASDTDGGSLRYAASGLPPGLSIDPATGVISGVPTTTGVYAVTVTATDAKGPSGSVAFNWTVSSSTSGACEPSSSLSAMVNGTNVVSYVPHGNWESSATDLSAVNVEGSSVTPTHIPTPNVVNSAASNPLTGETVATANNTDVYLLKGTNLVSTLASGGSGAIGFSGGGPTDAGVAMDAASNLAVITLSVAGVPGFQFLDLGSNTFYPPIASPGGRVSEDPLIDPVRNLLLSASENGDFEIVGISNPASPTFYENQTGLTFLDSSGEDCSTGIVLAPAEGSNPSEVYVADLTQATFTSGSPAGTWSAPSQIQTLSESSLSAGASAVAVAQGTHTGVIAGEFSGNEVTAFALPATSGTGTPAIADWVSCGIDSTPDGSAWSEGQDPHTVTAYQTPSNGDAVGLFANDSANWLARVDLTQLLNPAIVPRDAVGHACASGTIPSSVESFIPVP